MQNEVTQRNILLVCWENLLQLIGLNLLFLVCCIPVITIPAAIVGLSSACRCCLMNYGHLFKVYVRAFRRSILSALPVGVFFMIILCGFAYGTIFYAVNSEYSIICLACSIFCMVAFYLVFCMGGFTFQLMASKELSPFKAIKTGVRLTLQNPGILFTWFALSCVFLGVAVWFFPYTLPFVAMLAFSLSNMLEARGIFPVLEEYLEKEDL